MRPVTPPTALSVLVTGGVFVVALLMCSLPLNHAAVADDVKRVNVSPARPQRTLSLRDRLVVGLQARRKSEVEFVELVALRVKTGHLPRRLVDTTFFWARQRASVKNRGRVRRPILFFQPAMRLRAERVGVPL
jgi:hypothetical protein